MINQLTEGVYLKIIESLQINNKKGSGGTMLLAAVEKRKKSKLKYWQVKLSYYKCCCQYLSLIFGFPR